MTMHDRVASVSLLLFLSLEACSGTGSPLTPNDSLSHQYATPERTASHRAVATAASGGVSVSGQITNLFSGGFTIYETAGCGYSAHVHVFTSSSTTMNGPAPAAGMNAIASGSGSCANGVAASTVTTNATMPAGSSASPSPIPLRPNDVSFSSTIASLWKGGFTLNPQGSYGSLHVYTGASTATSGGTPKVGLHAVTTGSGGVRNYQAAYVALYTGAPPTVTLSGTAIAATAYGFTMNAGASNPSVPVVLNAATIVGGATLATGATVRVTGTGSAATAIAASQIVVSTPSPAPNATPTATPAPIAQKHVLTADYLGSPNGSTTIAWSAAAPYLTWGQTAWQNANAVSAAGIKTQYYIDPNRTTAGTGDQLYTSDETTFAHDCSGNRVTDVYAGKTKQYVMNIGGSSMQNLFANLVTRISGLGHYDALYEDDSGPLSEAVYTPFSAMPCDYTDAAWLAAGRAINQVSSVPVIFNGLDALDGHGVSLSAGLLDSSNTIGGNYEHCYSDDQTAKMSGWVWQAIENTELQVAAKNKIFECQLRRSSSASSQTDARIYAMASFLLTYNPATSVLWEAFATPSGFHVQPESQLVVLNPVGNTPATIAGLAQNGGTYGRQYSDCYVAGRFVSSCAIVVNADPVLAHPFPFPQYAHTLTLSGGGVLDGGTLSTAGPPPPSTIAADEAAIVFP